MNDSIHVLVATPKSHGQLMDSLGPRVHVHLAQAADECLALAASLHPDAAVIDIDDDEMGTVEFVRMVRRTLGTRVPMVGLGASPCEELAGEFIRAGLRDVWSWDDAPSLLRRRLKTLTRVFRLNHAVRRSHSKSDDARKALVQFLRRMEEIVAHPVDALEAYLLLLHDSARRGAPPSPDVLDDVGCQLQEIRRTISRVRDLGRKLAGSPDAAPNLKRGLKEEKKLLARFSGRVR